MESSGNKVIDVSSFYKTSVLASMCSKFCNWKLNADAYHIDRPAKLLTRERWLFWCSTFTLCFVCSNCSCQHAEHTGMLHVQWICQLRGQTCVACTRCHASTKLTIAFMQLWQLFFQRWDLFILRWWQDLLHHLSMNILGFNGITRIFIIWLCSEAHVIHQKQSTVYYFCLLLMFPRHAARSHPRVASDWTIVVSLLSQAISARSIWHGHLGVGNPAIRIEETGIGGSFLNHHDHFISHKPVASTVLLMLNMDVFDCTKCAFD